MIFAGRPSLRRGTRKWLPDRSPARHRSPLDWRHLLGKALQLLSFGATTMLLAWGVIILMLLALGGFTLDGLMAHLDNLAARYLAADAGRRAQFKLLLIITQAIIVVALIAARRGVPTAPSTKARL